MAVEMKHILVILLLVYPALQSNAACPSACSCTQGNTVVDCSDRGLTSIPALASNVETLNLAGNRIGNLGSGGFASLSSLVNLDLSNNLLTTLAGGMFSGLINLQTLFLRNNSIQGIDPALCEVLPSLQTLDLNDNMLTSISNLYEDCLELASLHVANNLLGEDIFSALNNVNWLTEIDVSGNVFTKLPYLMLNRMVALQSLSMRHGQIERIDSNAFVGLTNLQTLDISHNKITNIRREMFQSLPDSLQSMGLGGNPLVCQCGTKQVQDLINSEKLTVLGTAQCTDSSGDKYDVVLSDLSFLCEELTPDVPGWCSYIQLSLLILESSAHRIVCGVQYSGIDYVEQFDRSVITVGYHAVGQGDTAVPLSANSSEVIFDDIQAETGYVICVRVPMCLSGGCQPQLCRETVTPLGDGTVLPTKSKCPDRGVLIGGTAAIFVFVILLMLLIFFITLKKMCCCRGNSGDYKKGDIAMKDVTRNSPGSLRSQENAFYESIPEEQAAAPMRQSREPNQTPAQLHQRHRSVGDPVSVENGAQDGRQPRRSDITGFVPGKAQVFRKLDDNEKQRVFAKSQPNLLSVPSVNEDRDTPDVGIRHRDRTDAPFRQSGMPTPERKRKMHGSFPKMGQSAILSLQPGVNVPQAAPQSPENLDAIPDPRRPPVPAKESQPQTFWTKSGMPSLPDIPQETERDNVIQAGTGPPRIWNGTTLNSQRQQTPPTSPHFYNEPDL